MVGIFVTFRYGENFSEAAVRKIAENARVKFDGMPQLHSKAFTFDPEKHEATNFYIWDSNEAARAFFTDERIASVTGVYGVRPVIQYVQIAALVENNRT